MKQFAYVCINSVLCCNKTWYYVLCCNMTQYFILCCNIESASRPYHQKLMLGQTYPPPSQIPETLVEYVRPPAQTCPASQHYPGLTKPI
jgi:hypothetical protein